MIELVLTISVLYVSIGGSVVECSPATRAARVRFPADAHFCQFYVSFLPIHKKPLCSLSNQADISNLTNFDMHVVVVHTCY